MARFTLVTSLPKFGHAGAIIAKARTWNPRVFAAATPRPIQVPSSNQDGSVTGDGIKHGASETINVNENMQDKAYSTGNAAPSSQASSGGNNRMGGNPQDKAHYTAEQVNHQAREMAGKVSATAQNITEKAKQTMQEAWDSTRNTAQKAADTVRGKAQESAETVKENAESVKRSMNTKQN